MRRFLLLALPLFLVLAACHVVGPERFVVFFSPWSSDLDAPGKQVIATVADRAKQRPGVMIVINGYASPIGAANANQKLSERRAQGVEDALVAAGVPTTNITRHALGAVAFEMDPIESRRVEISLGQP